MSRHWIVLTVGGFLVGGTTILAIWWLYRKIICSNIPWRVTVGRIPIIRRMGGGPKTQSYELVQRDEESL